MLGCHDFCGYYDWTFHHVRQLHGQDAVWRLWAEAIGGESQRHYADAGARDGLRGLYNTWVRTGEDEHCEWTFTLDESRNVLRWDMRECPSKGFLIRNDLNADEDYCDHCMGWVVPLLDSIGMDIVAHEHNHCGQCWTEIGLRGRPVETLDLACDIRKDPRWPQGYIERWALGQKQPLAADVSTSSDPSVVLEDAFRGFDRLIVLGSDAELHLPGGPNDAVMVTGALYARPDSYPQNPSGVLLGSDEATLERVGQRFRQARDDTRPLLLHAYWPAGPRADFRRHGLPRPLPVLPRLIRAGLYTHIPGAALPTPEVLLVLIAVSIGKPVLVFGVQPATTRVGALDIRHLRRAVRAAVAPVTFAGDLNALLFTSNDPPETENSR